MKIKDIFEEEQIGNEHVMVSLDSDVLCGIIRANETASFIISCIKEETTVQEVISNVCDYYDISEERAAIAVKKIINQLIELNLIQQ